MIVRQTSIDAYIAMQEELGPSQQLVYDALTRFEAACNREIAAHLGRETSFVSGRMNELVKNGLVKESHRAKYRGTNRRVIYWKIAD